MMTEFSEFKPRTLLVVTKEAMRTMFTSKHATRFPETPNVLLLDRRRKGEVMFARPNNSGVGKTWGCHLFVPANIKVGDVLEIEWTDNAVTDGKDGKKHTTYSACARIVDSQVARCG